MTDDPFAGWVEVRLEHDRFSVQPGKAVVIPVDLYNPGGVVDHLEFTIEGIASEWLGAPLPIVMLQPGERRQISLVIQPPSEPTPRAGIYPLVLRVSSLRLRARSMEIDLTLTVAAAHSEGAIGAYLAQTVFSVQPNQQVSFLLILINHDFQVGHYHIHIQGLPLGWCKVLPEQLSLQPGEQAAVSVTLSPPRTPESRAGLYAFSVVIVSEAPAHPPVVLPCQLSVGRFFAYRLSLQTPNLTAGEVGNVLVQNVGNSADIYTLQFSHPRDALAFQILSPPAEAVGAHRAEAEKPHLSPWGERKPQARLQIRGDQGGGYQGLLLHIPAGGELTIEFALLPLRPPAWQARQEPFIIEAESARREYQRQEGVVTIPPVAYPRLVRVALGLFLIAFMGTFLLLAGLILQSMRALLAEPANPTWTIPVVPWTGTAIVAPMATQTLPPVVTPTGASLPFTPTQTLAPGVSVTLPPPTATLAPTLLPFTPTWTVSVPTPVVTIPIFPIQNLGRLAMDSDLEGGPGIYVFDTQTRRFELLHAQTKPGTQPAWSPDGKRLAFATNREGQYEIYVLQLDNGVVFNLTNHPADDTEPAWSPDGQKIAFTSNRDGNLEIYVADLATQQAVNLTRNPAEDSQPDWFIMQRIAFTSNRDGNPEIYMMNPDGTGQYNFSNNPASDTQPAGARDGSGIAFVSNRDRNSEIYVMNLEGTNQVNLSRNPGADEAPAWSPDVQWIAFATDRDGNWEIYVMKRDGSTPFNLTSLPSAEKFPSWIGAP